ncbi:MAG: hypothetical protein KGL35_30100 [Bradyrhizobium sp.]|nr:hypothetical protein [Bradyrhizobium sp.]
MITILAIYESHSWAAEGHSREAAEEHYIAAVSFFTIKPLYRVVVTPKYRPIRDVIIDLATRRLPRTCEFHGYQIQFTASEES